MCFESIIGFVFLGVAVFGYAAYSLLSRVNWAMIYFNLCGGMEYDD